MNEPVEPHPPGPVDPGVAGPLDEDASLTVDQVSDDPPEADLILANPCRDALVQSAPCPLVSTPRPAPSARPAPVTAAPPRVQPRTPTPAPARAAAARPAAKPARAATSITGARLATRALGLGKGEMASLDGAGSPSSEPLAESCSERGPRLALTARQPDVIDEGASVDISFSAPAPRAAPLVPTPSIPVVLSEPPPSASPASIAPSSAAPPTSATRRPNLPRKAAPTPAPAVKLTPVGDVAPKPIGLISDFDDPPELDPLQARGVPLRPPPPRPRHKLPPRAVALFGGVFGLAAISTLLAFLIHPGAAPTGPGAAASASGKPAARAAAPSPAPSSSEAARASASARPPEPPPDPGPWRVASLSSEEGVKIISGKLGTKSLTTALEDERVPKPQIFRILKAFDDAKLFDKPKKSHQYTVAIDRASKRVRGFEYQASATEVWQAREVDERLAGTKLDLKIEQRRVAKGIVVKDDLKSALVEAGLDDDMVALLDEALSDRVSVERFGKGTSLRIVAQEQLVAGRFSKYLALDAVEYKLPRSEKRTRLYQFRNGKVSGVFDSNGKAPFRSSWGPPLKVVRVTSRFNPKRLHPVLHTVMPHNGTDFGAPSGTPVYSVAAGTVSHVGPHGPSGNLVLVEHPNGLESGYAHLSKFAQGIKKGDKVESQQLVGYVGSTGRSTGPHLHFSIKKNGAYIDGLTVIKLNQERVIPKNERGEFDTFRAEMDRLFDAIPLAEQPSDANGAPDPDADPDSNDQNNHGEEDERPAASGAAPAAPAPAAASGPPAPAPAAPVTDDTTPESAVWRPD